MKFFTNTRLIFSSLILIGLALGLQACGGGGGGGNTGIAGQKIYMSATDGVKGYELYASDGTSGGTALIKDINSTGSSNPRKLIEMNGVVYFCADDGVNTSSLWKTDGTTAGTVLVHSVKVECAGFRPPVIIGNTFYFVGETVASGKELWKSDGTPAGTVMVKDISAGARDSSPWSLVTMGGNLYFAASDAITPNTWNSELWKSDGTTDGTVLVKDIIPGITNGSSPSNLLVIGNMIYFTAIHPSYGNEIWKSDGTTAGTNLLVDINPNIWACDNSPLGSYPAMLTRMGDKFYFTANDNPNNSCSLVINGPQLWVSDGTTTSKLIEFTSFPRRLTAVGNTLFFSGYTSATGTELWKSDGTVAGTVMVKDINQGTGPGIVYNGFTSLFFAVNDTLYFSATDGVTGPELWKSDGLESNTMLVKDINTTSVSAGSTLGKAGRFTGSYFSQYSKINTTAYFTANNGINGLELWRSDGTGNGTALVSDINLGGFDGVDSIFK